MKLTLKSVGLLAMATLFVQCGRPSEDAVEQNASAVRLTKVGVQTVQAAPFAHTFAVQGNVETDRIANVLAEFPGVVREVFVEEGAKSTKAMRWCASTPTCWPSSERNC